MGRHRPHLPKVQVTYAAVPRQRRQRRAANCAVGGYEEKYHTLGKHRLAACTQGVLAHVRGRCSS